MDRHEPAAPDARRGRGGMALRLFVHDAACRHPGRVGHRRVRDVPLVPGDGVRPPRRARRDAGRDRDSRLGAAGQLLHDGPVRDAVRDPGRHVVREGPRAPDAPHTGARHPAVRCGCPRAPGRRRRPGRIRRRLARHDATAQAASGRHRGRAVDRGRVRRVRLLQVPCAGPGRSRGTGVPARTSAGCRAQVPGRREQLPTRGPEEHGVDGRLSRALHGHVGAVERSARGPHRANRRLFRGRNRCRCDLRPWVVAPVPREQRDRRRGHRTVHALRRHHARAVRIRSLTRHRLAHRRPRHRVRHRNARGGDLDRQRARFEPRRAKPAQRPGSSPRSSSATSRHSCSPTTSTATCCSLCPSSSWWGALRRPGQYAPAVRWRSSASSASCCWAARPRTTTSRGTGRAGRRSTPRGIWARRPGRSTAGSSTTGTIAAKPLRARASARAWWWVEDDRFVVAFSVPPGYVERRRFPVDRWLPRTPATIFLSERPSP